MKTRKFIVLTLVVVVVVAIILTIKRERGVTRDLAGNTIQSEEDFLHEPRQNTSQEESNDDEKRDSQERILVTDGVRHTIPLEDILSGGPPKDGIPSIDKPKFVDIRTADKEIDEEGLGIAVSLQGVDKFYPNQILVWHEIVNDIIGGQPALITYCPLCGTGIVFSPMVNGRASTFGTSGKLWNSNLIMYDRVTESYWSQVLGRSIVGPQSGKKLELLPHENITYKDWKEAHPQGLVLSTDTGFFRDYNDDPYGSYYTNKSIFFPVDNTDERYHPKAYTYGVEINNQFKVYPQEELAKGQTQIRDTFAGTDLELTYDTKTQTLKIFDLNTSTEIVPVFGFWFSWISVHPDSEVYIAP